MGMQLRCFIVQSLGAAGCIVGYAEHLSRFAIRVRCVHVSVTAIPPVAGDPIHVYVELPGQRPDRRRCLFCIATVTNTSAERDGESVIAAGIEDMQFRDLPARYATEAVLKADPGRTLLM